MNVGAPPPNRNVRRCCLMGGQFNWVFWMVVAIVLFTASLGAKRARKSPHAVPRQAGAITEMAFKGEFIKNQTTTVCGQRYHWAIDFGVNEEALLVLYSYPPSFGLRFPFDEIRLIQRTGLLRPYVEILTEHDPSMTAEISMKLAKRLANLSNNRLQLSA
jgi:hypothetical protein